MDKILNRRPGQSLGPVDIIIIIMPPPLIGGALSDAFVWRLSVSYIGPKSRTERPRKTKIGTEAAHVTRDSDTTFRVQRSRSPGRFTHRRVKASGSCSGQRGNVLLCFGRLGGMRRFGAHWGRKGAGAYCVATRTACIILTHWGITPCPCYSTSAITNRTKLNCNKAC